MLSSIDFLDHEKANNISMFASYWHNIAAEDITNVICDFIRDVSVNQPYLAFNFPMIRARYSL